MAKETNRQKEQRINELITDCYSLEQCIDNYVYLTNKNRIGGSTTVANIRKQYLNRNMASLIKRLDPIGYSQM